MKDAWLSEHPFDLSNATRIEGGIRLYGGGGGSTSTTVPTIPEEFKPLAKLYTGQATRIAQTPYQNYRGQRYANLTGAQQQGIGMVRDRALNGSKTMGNAENELNQFIGGQNRSATRNPYGDVAGRANNDRIYGGVNNDRIIGGTNNDRIYGGRNAYAGSNPYLEQAVGRAQGSVVDQFNNMTKPQTEAAMVNSGSFGNSGYQQAMQVQQKGAAQQLGDIASSMYMQDYGNQQQLAESAINRDLSAQQYNSGLTEANLGRDMQAGLANLGTSEANLGRNFAAQQYNSGLNESNINRDFAAQQYNSNMGQDWATRNDSVNSAQDNNRMQAIGMAPTFGNAAYSDASQLLSAGGIQQQQNQNNLDFAYQQFQNRQDYPFKQLQATGGVVGSNLGSKTTSSGGGGK